MDEVPLYSSGTAAKPRNTHTQPDGEDGSFGETRGGRLELDQIRFLPLFGKGEAYIDGVQINRLCQNRGPIELDRFTDPIPPKPVLRLRRLLHPRTSSGSIPRNQTERGHRPIIVLEMAWVRQ